MTLTTDITLGISAASLLLSAYAVWRTGRARVLDLRTQTRRDVVELQITMTDLVQRIHAAVRSRSAINAADGGSGGPTAVFKNRADEDLDDLGDLRDTLGAIEPIRWFTSYDAMEIKHGRVHMVRTCIQQTAKRYEEAAAEDARRQEHIREAKIAQVFGHPLLP